VTKSVHAGEAVRFACHRRPAVWVARWGWRAVVPGDCLGHGL